MANHVPSNLFWQRGGTGLPKFSVSLYKLVKLCGALHQVLDLTFSKIGLPQPDQLSYLVHGGVLGHSHQNDGVCRPAASLCRSSYFCFDQFVPLTQRIGRIELPSSDHALSLGSDG